MRLVTALATLLVALSAWSCQTAPKADKPGSVIFLIGDGFGYSQLTIGRWVAHQGEGRLALESLPVTGNMSTFSASNAVTDSAAAGTALATGVKTDNQRIGQTPDGRDLNSLADAAKANGWRVGYVTNTTLTHATPASFYANVENRYRQVDDIGAQLLEQRPDVALGGGRADFLPVVEFGNRQDSRNLLEEARGAGYTVWDYETGLVDEEAPPLPLLGLFAGSHLGYRLDEQNTPESLRSPSLARLTRLALAALSQDDQPFFLMVEGGRIDHAGHGFDAAGVIAQVQAFDEAVAEVLAYLEQHPDTLVVLTADHATGGLAINDFVNWEELARQRASLEIMTARVRDEEDPAGLDYLAEMTGYDDLTEENLERVRLIGDKYTAGRYLATLLAERHGVTFLPRVDEWNTKGHTGEDVPLFAGGPGAERFQGTLDNTDVPKRIAELLGWPELNP